MAKYIEILIFAAFALFSLLSQYLTKKRKAVTRAPEAEVRREDEGRSDEPRSPVTARSRRRPARTQQAPTSLEEILRELTGQPPEEEPEEESDYELPPYLQEKQQEAQEAALEPVRQPMTPRKTLADKISLEDDGKRIKPLKTSVKRRNQSLGASVAQSLHNPENVKRAIIVSEILQRKHF